MQCFSLSSSSGPPKVALKHKVSEGPRKVAQVNVVRKVAPHQRSDGSRNVAHEVQHHQSPYEDEGNEEEEEDDHGNDNFGDDGHGDEQLIESAAENEEDEEENEFGEDEEDEEEEEEEEDERESCRNCAIFDPDCGTCVSSDYGAKIDKQVLLLYISKYYFRFRPFQIYISLFFFCFVPFISGGRLQ